MVCLGVGKRNEYRCGEYQGGGMKGVFTIKYDWLLLIWRLEKSLYSTATRNDSCRRVGLDPQHDHFVLGVPTCWYLKKPLRTQCEPLATHVDPLATQHEPVEYSLRWVFALGIRVVHVDFMLFV